MNLVETKPSELGEFQYKKYRLTMHLYQGKKIPALDGNGLCDPFVMVHFNGEHVRFPVQKNTLNPQWYLTREMTVKLPSQLSLASDIYISVFDWDLTGTEFIGGFFLR